MDDKSNSCLNRADISLSSCYLAVCANCRFVVASADSDDTWLSLKSHRPKSCGFHGNRWSKRRTSESFPSCIADDISRRYQWTNTSSSFPALHSRRYQRASSFFPAHSLRSRQQDDYLFRRHRRSNPKTRWILHEKKYYEDRNGFSARTHWPDNTLFRGSSGLLT